MENNRMGENENTSQEDLCRGGNYLYTEDIKKIIPHRYPFLLVDRIESLVCGKSASGYKNVTANEHFFEGHFPEKAVMPGVLIIEALAQVGAVIVLSVPENNGKIAYFAGIKSAKFKRVVVPGDCLKLEVEMVKMRKGVGVGKAVAKVDGKVVCECELMVMF